MKAPHPPRISESEWKVMKILWQQSPLDANEISARLRMHPQTVRTFLSRLVQKKALRFHKKARSHFYEPLVSEADSKTAATRSFLQRVFGGSLHPMLTHLVENRELSRKEMSELRRLLNRNRKPK